MLSGGTTRKSDNVGAGVGKGNKRQTGRELDLNEDQLGDSSIPIPWRGIKKKWIL